jgi:SPP1 gp7 family putative phage head morphogenesis protein
MMSAKDELEKFLDRKGAIFADALVNLISTRKSPSKQQDALKNLADLIRHTMILADLHGRRRALMEADRIRRRGAKFTAIPDSTPIAPGVPFEEAIDRLLAAEPRLARSMEEVSSLYSDQKVFAMARSASLKITERVQKEVTALIEKGKSAAEVETIILDIGKNAQMGEVRRWTRSYAATVYRTNASTAYTTGRFAQAQDADVKEVIGALELVGVVDGAERPNHAAARGLIAPADHPIWKRFAPPLGYQCRHGVEFVSVFELERRGLIKDGRVIPYFPPGFQNAKPDPGFEVRRIDFGAMGGGM